MDSPGSTDVSTRLSSLYMMSLLLVLEHGMEMVVPVHGKLVHAQAVIWQVPLEGKLQSYILLKPEDSDLPVPRPTETLVLMSLVEHEQGTEEIQGYYLYPHVDDSIHMSWNVLSDKDTFDLEKVQPTDHRFISGLITESTDDVLDDLYQGAMVDIVEEAVLTGVAAHDERNQSD